MLAVSRCNSATCLLLPVVWLSILLAFKAEMKMRIYILLNCHRVFQLQLTLYAISLLSSTRNLNGNKIQLIPSGIFDAVSSLRSLHLERNPLSCNCDMMWLYRYLQANRRLSATGNCIVSGSTGKRRLSELRDKDFQCS